MLARCVKANSLFSPLELNSFGRRDKPDSSGSGHYGESVSYFLSSTRSPRRRATTRQMLLGESVKVLEGIRGIAALELLVKSVRFYGLLLGNRSLLYRVKSKVKMARNWHSFTDINHTFYTRYTSDDFQNQFLW